MASVTSPVVLRVTNAADALSDIRLAITPRIPVSGMVRLGSMPTSEVGVPPSAAARTSSSVTLPLGPVPVSIASRSTFSSRARRRARGVTTGPPRPRLGVPPRREGPDERDARSRGASSAGRSLGDSPDSSSRPKIVPTGTVFPSSTMIRPRVPSAVASTSALTFVDSISTRGSPLRTEIADGFEPFDDLPLVHSHAPLRKNYVARHISTLSLDVVSVCKVKSEKSS